MKDNITSREDIFLAKIAGKDVDIKTMTPPVAASMREKLMLDIADRIDSIEAGSGGGDTYETVLEMQLGEPVSTEGKPEWITLLDAGQYSSEIEPLKGDIIYIKTEKTGDTVYPMDYDDECWTNNVVFVEGIPEIDHDSQHGFILAAFSAENCLFGSDVDLSNTTVTILKKVSTVDDELSETSENPVQNKVIMAALAQLADMIDSANPLIVPGTIDGSTAVSTQGVPLETIYQTFADGRAVYFEAEVEGARGRYPCTSVKQSGSDYIVTYAAPMVAGGTAHVVQIKFDGSDTNGTFTMGS